MTARILVAGVGNVFFGDDGFGVEVVRRLLREPFGEGVKVADFGIRGVHLAYELLEPPALLVIVDAVSRGAAPGTLFVLEADPEEAPGATADAHGMDLPSVFAAVKAMGGRLPRVLVVGCEPACVEEGMALSREVEAALPEAVRMVRKLLEQELAQTGAAEGRP